MRAHTRKSEVLARYLKRNKFTVSQVECSLDRHSVSGRSEYLAVEGRIPLGASAAFLFAHVERR